MASTKGFTSITDLRPDPTEEAALPHASASPAAERVPPIVLRQGGGWQTTAVVCLSLLLLTTVGIAFYAFHRVSELKDEMGTTMRRIEAKLQNLDAGISFDSKRQQLLLGMRDEIMRINPTVSLTEAFDYATLILQATEKYPSVDPLLFLAIGTVESRYDLRATSHANAKGLYQLWPSTARLLARSLDWEYSDEMLYDPAKNTELAALYLDILFTAYNDEKMVLAEYNGGPLNAGYLRAGSARAAAETREYVRRVEETFARLKEQFETGVQASIDPMYKDRDRNGKLLGRHGAPASSTAAWTEAAAGQ